MQFELICIGHDSNGWIFKPLPWIDGEYAKFGRMIELFPTDFIYCGF